MKAYSILITCYRSCPVPFNIDILAPNFDETEAAGPSSGRPVGIGKVETVRSAHGGAEATKLLPYVALQVSNQVTTYVVLHFANAFQEAAKYRVAQSQWMDG